MPKTRQQKETAVQSLVEGIKKAKSVIFANFQGLTVVESEELRKKCYKEGIDVVAAKKTLIQRALEEAGLGAIQTRTFEGGVATFLGNNDEISPAKIVSTFAKSHGIVTIFGGIFEGKFIDQNAVRNLANLPSKDELLAKMVGSLNAPVSGFVHVLAGNLRNLVGVLNNIKNAKA